MNLGQSQWIVSTDKKAPKTKISKMAFRIVIQNVWPEWRVWFFCFFISQSKKKQTKNQFWLETNLDFSVQRPNWKINDLLSSAYKVESPKESSLQHPKAALLGTRAQCLGPGSDLWMTWIPALDRNCMCKEVSAPPLGKFHLFSITPEVQHGCCKKWMEGLYCCPFNAG